MNVFQVCVGTHKGQKGAPDFPPQSWSYSHVWAWLWVLGPKLSRRAANNLYGKCLLASILLFHLLSICGISPAMELQSTLCRLLRLLENRTFAHPPNILVLNWTALTPVSLFQRYLECVTCLAKKTGEWVCLGCLVPPTLDPGDQARLADQTEQMRAKHARPLSGFFWMFMSSLALSVSKILRAHSSHVS